MSVKCHVYPCRTDNYGVLVYDDATGQTALIDVPEEMATRRAIEQTGWVPTHIFITHHHGDHIDGVGGIRGSFDVEVVGNAADAQRLPRLDRAVKEGDQVALGETIFDVLDTPGHTVGHIAYVSKADKLAFVADTLFAMGCGRMFEGTPEQFFGSLQKLAALPPETKIYCGHEYTEANANFALSVDPNNAALASHVDAIKAARAVGKPTVPTQLDTELAFNPFMRAKTPEDFASLRRAKDNF